MNPKKIVIVGGFGKMGSLFASLFESNGLDVVRVDHKSSLSPKDAVIDADVVIVCVPINITEEVIREIGPYIPSSSLFTDFTSLKVFPVDAMLKYSSAEVIGGHPVFGPSASLKDENFVLCNARGSSYLEWYTNLLTGFGLNVIIMDASDHDKKIAALQGLSSFSSLVLGLSLKDSSADMDLLYKLASPQSRLHLFGLCRVLNQDPSLYADIQMLNPFSSQILADYVKNAKLLQEIVLSNDSDSFEKLFMEVKTHCNSMINDGVKKSDGVVKR